VYADDQKGRVLAGPDDAVLEILYVLRKVAHFVLRPAVDKDTPGDHRHRHCHPPQYQDNGVSSRRRAFEFGILIRIVPFRRVSQNRCDAPVFTISKRDGLDRARGFRDRRRRFRQRIALRRRR
jgi:hypothetical protein